MKKFPSSPFSLSVTDYRGTLHAGCYANFFKGVMMKASKNLFYFLATFFACSLAQVVLAQDYTTLGSAGRLPDVPFRKYGFYKDLQVLAIDYDDANLSPVDLTLLSYDDAKSFSCYFDVINMQLGGEMSNSFVGWGATAREKREFLYFVYLEENIHMVIVKEFEIIKKNDGVCYGKNPLRTTLQ